MIELALLPDERVEKLRSQDPEPCFGALASPMGGLPLSRLGLDCRITGLHYRANLHQVFVNRYSQAVDAVYTFPLPPGASVTSLRMVAADRVVDGHLQERPAARGEYDEAAEQGKAVSLIEQERADVVTLTLANLAPGATVGIELGLTGVLSVADEMATFRFPLVVAPRYVPGVALDGSGTSSQTDGAPNANRLSPPVLLQGQPNPVEFALRVLVDPAGLQFGTMQSSLSALQVTRLPGGRLMLSLQPGCSRLDRDFVLGFALKPGQVTSAFGFIPDRDGQGGTFALTLITPPAAEAAGVDLVIVVDRCAAMEGWMLAAACRTARRIIGALSPSCRFAIVLAGDQPELFPSNGLAPATEQNIFRGLRLLTDLKAAGGGRLGAALQAAENLLSDPAREPTTVLLTGGHVGDQDQVSAHIDSGGSGRIHCLGIGSPPNLGLLEQLAGRSGGTHACLESPDRIDEVADTLVRRLAPPRISQLRVEGPSMTECSPGRPIDLFPGIPATLYGRYRGHMPQNVTVRGLLPGGGQAAQAIPTWPLDDPVLVNAWARARVHDLEYEHLVDPGRVEARQVTAFSLRWGVLSRFAAFVAADQTAVRRLRQPLHRVVCPAEAPVEVAEPPADPGAVSESALFSGTGFFAGEFDQEVPPDWLSAGDSPGATAEPSGEPPATPAPIGPPQTDTAQADELFAGPPEAAPAAGDELFTGAPEAATAAGDDFFAGPPEDAPAAGDELFAGAPEGASPAGDELFAEQPEAAPPDGDDLFAVALEAAPAPGDDLFAGAPGFDDPEEPGERAAESPTEAPPAEAAEVVQELPETPIESQAEPPAGPTTDNDLQQREDSVPDSPRSTEQPDAQPPSTPAPKPSNGNVAHPHSSGPGPSYTTHQTAQTYGVPQLRRGLLHPDEAMGWGTSAPKPTLKPRLWRKLGHLSNEQLIHLVRTVDTDLLALALADASQGVVDRLITAVGHNLGTLLRLRLAVALAERPDAVAQARTEVLQLMEAARL